MEPRSTVLPCVGAFGRFARWARRLSILVASDPVSQVHLRLVARWHRVEFHGSAAAVIGLCGQQASSVYPAYMHALCRACTHARMRACMVPRRACAPLATHSRRFVTASLPANTQGLVMHACTHVAMRTFACTCPSTWPVAVITIAYILPRSETWAAEQ